MATLQELLDYGDSIDPATGQPRANAIQQVEAIQRWTDNAHAWAQSNITDKGQLWLGRQAIEAAAQPVREELRTRAMAETAQGLFPDPEERISFLQTLDAASGDWQKMDAPESWKERARLIDDVGKAPPFQTPRYQTGQVGLGPNVLGRYTIREEPDGFSAIVTPTAEGAEPVEIRLPNRATLAEQARAVEAERLDAVRNNSFASAAVLDPMAAAQSGAPPAVVQQLREQALAKIGASDPARDLVAAYDAASQRAALLADGPESVALHAGLDMQLRQTPEFLATVPQNWLSQFTARPILQGVRGLAQAWAALPGTSDEALTAEGAAALESATPGALRNRYAADGDLPVADQIATGIESFATIAGPGLTTKLAGRILGSSALPIETRLQSAGTQAAAVAAQRSANAARAGWTGLYASSFGQNYAAAQQTATALEADDPAAADRIRRWAGLTSAAKAGIELATERIFPGETDILTGSARHWRQIATMPFQEAVEETAGAIGQGMVNRAVGDPTREDPTAAFVGGLFGSIPFVGASAARAALASRPTAPTAEETDPLPPDDTAPAESRLSAIAQRGGRFDPTATEPEMGGAPVPADLGGTSGPDAALFPPGGADVAAEAIPDTPDELEDGSPNPLPNGVTPEEALAFQAAQDRWLQENPDRATAPEPLRTFAEQLDVVRTGDKPAMIFEGLTRDDIPRALRPVVGMGDTAGVQTPGGFVVYHKEAVKPLLGLKPTAPAASVQTFVRSAFERPEAAGQLLGYGVAEKPADADRVVAVRAADGTEVLAVAASEQTEPAVRAATAQAAARIRRRNRSDSSQTFREQPLAKMIIGMGGIMGRSAGRRAGLWRTASSMWEDAPTRLSDPTHNAIYGEQPPDQIATAAAQAGLISSDSITELWAKIAEESRTAAGEAAARRAERDQLDEMEQLATNEEAEFTLAMRAQARADERRAATRRLLRPVSNASQYDEQPDAPAPQPTVKDSLPVQPAEEDDDYVPFARPTPSAGRSRGVSLSVVQQALSLLDPAIGRNVRAVQSIADIAAERDRYTPTDWADMHWSRGIYDPATGQATVFAGNIDVRPNETPLRAAARVVLHERVAHAGLASLREIDPQFARRWADLVRQIPRQELFDIAETYPELSGNVNALAEEWLAAQVETRADKFLATDSLARRIWNAIRDALAAIFRRFSRRQPLDSEVNEVIRLSVAALRAKAQTTAGEPVQFAGRLQQAKADGSARGMTDSDMAQRKGSVLMWRAGSQTGKQGFTFFASNADYAANYGEPKEYLVDGGNILDLTEWEAEEDVSGAEFLESLSKKGVDTSGLLPITGEPLQQISQRYRDPEGELARRIKAAGFDSVKINEYVYGGGSDTTLAVIGEDQSRVQFAGKLQKAKASSSARGMTDQDSAYLAAVEAGDMATAQRMVDEAANKSGLPIAKTIGDVRSALETSQKKVNPMEEGQFFRAGTLPRSGRSFNYADQKAEDGVSVYAIPMADSFAGMTGRDWYVGRGILLSKKGSDGEPLITPVGKWVKFFDPKADALAGFANPETKWAIQNQLIADDRAVVRDESGNVIPLSQRFNPQSEPIKFARPGLRSTTRYAGKGPYRVQEIGWRATLTGSALPAEFADLARMGQNEQKALNQTAAQLGTDLQSAITEHAKRYRLAESAVLDLVDAAMADPIILQTMTAGPLREATRRARNYLDDLSEAIATITGGQLGSAIMGNRGHWMRRSYAAFDPAAGWHYDALKAAAQKNQLISGRPAREILRDAEAFLLTEDPKRTPAQIEAIIRGLMERTNWETVLTGGGISKPVESLMRRKELPAELRAVMGEERNPLKRFTLSAGFQGTFVARHEMQTRMADLGLRMGIFATAREGVYTEPLSDGSPTPAGQRRSGFAGLFTTPEMKAALAAGQGTTPENISQKIVAAIHWLGGEAKLNKVALNPDSWSTNIAGNMIGLVQTGDAFTLSAWVNVRKAIEMHRSGRDQARHLGTVRQAVIDAQRAMLARLTAAGVADSSATLDDLQASLNNRVTQFIEHSETWDRVSGGMRGALIGQGFGRIFGTAGQALGAVAGAAAGTAIGGKRIRTGQQAIANWVLGNPDRFAKITTFLGNYETHLAAGMAERAAFELAAEKTLDTMPDYSRMPELARGFSKVGLLGSFIAFQVEVYRNAYHNTRYAAQEIRSGNPALMARGARRLMGVAATQVLNFAGCSAILGISGAAWAYAMGDREDEAYRRWLARPWERFGRLAYTAFDGEKASFYNTSYLVPQVTMGEIIRAALEGRDLGEALGNAGTASANQWAGGGVHTDPLLETLLNTRKDGTKVSYEDGGRQWAERALYFIRRVLEPGAIDKADRLVRAATGRDRGTRAFSVEEELLRLMGVRQSTYKHADAIRSRLYEFRNQYAEISAEARRQWKDNAPGARPAALTRANERIGQLVLDYRRFLTDMETLDLAAKVPEVNDNRTADGRRVPILPKAFRPLVETPDGPKHATE